MKSARHVRFGEKVRTKMLLSTVGMSGADQDHGQDEQSGERQIALFTGVFNRTLKVIEIIPTELNHPEIHLKITHF